MQTVVNDMSLYKTRPISASKTDACGEIARTRLRSGYLHGGYLYRIVSGWLSIHVAGTYCCEQIGFRWACPSALWSLAGSVASVQSSRPDWFAACLGVARQRAPVAVSFTLSTARRLSDSLVPLIRAVNCATATCYDEQSSADQRRTQRKMLPLVFHTFSLLKNKIIKRKCHESVKFVRSAAGKQNNRRDIRCKVRRDVYSLILVDDGKINHYGTRIIRDTLFDTFSQS